MSITVKQMTKIIPPKPIDCAEARLSDSVKPYSSTSGAGISAGFIGGGSMSTSLLSCACVEDIILAVMESKLRICNNFKDDRTRF